LSTFELNKPLTLLACQSGVSRTMAYGVVWPTRNALWTLRGKCLRTCNSMISRVIATLNEAAADKIRDYRADYNNHPCNAISFMPAVASTSGRLHCELERILYLQAHRETCFFAAPGIQLAQSNQFPVTTVARRSTPSSNRRSGTSSPKMQHCVSIEILMTCP
jgi:hypothetical protein